MGINQSILMKLIHKASLRQMSVLLTTLLLNGLVLDEPLHRKHRNTFLSSGKANTNSSRGGSDGSIAKQISFYDSENSFFEQIRINCNIHNCKPEFGRCSADRKYCQCSRGFLHVPRFNSKKRLCHYSQHSQFNIILLELLLPGLGYLFLGFFNWGVFKVLTIPTVYMYWAVQKGFNLFLISLVGFFLIYSHVRDLLMLFANQQSDREGIPMY